MGAIMIKEELKAGIWGIISENRKRYNTPTTIVMGALSEISLEVKADEMSEMLMEARYDEANQNGAKEGRGTEKGGAGTGEDRDEESNLGGDPEK